MLAQVPDPHLSASTPGRLLESPYTAAQVFPEGSVKQASKLVAEVEVAATTEGKLEEPLKADVQLEEVGSDRQASREATEVREFVREAGH